MDFRLTYYFMHKKTKKFEITNEISNIKLKELIIVIKSDRNMIRTLRNMYN